MKTWHITPPSARIQQLELALELKENERVQLLARSMSAQRSPAQSSSRSQDYRGFHSDCGAISQPDNPPPLRLNVFNPFANAFNVFGHIGNTFSKGVAPESTNAVSTVGPSGSQSSQTWVFRRTCPTPQLYAPCRPQTNLGTRRR